MTIFKFLTQMGFGCFFGVFKIRHKLFYFYQPIIFELKNLKNCCVKLSKLLSKFYTLKKLKKAIKIETHMMDFIRTMIFNRQRKI